MHNGAPPHTTSVMHWWGLTPWWLAKKNRTKMSVWNIMSVNMFSNHKQLLAWDRPYNMDMDRGTSSFWMSAMSPHLLRQHHYKSQECHAQCQRLSHCHPLSAASISSQENKWDHLFPMTSGTISSQENKWAESWYHKWQHTNASFNTLQPLKTLSSQSETDCCGEKELRMEIREVGSWVKPHRQIPACIWRFKPRIHLIAMHCQATSNLMGTLWMWAQKAL